jgi:hypothetical protein
MKNSLKCLFGHKWNGCKCERCGAVRDEEHKCVIMEGKCIEKCSVCGKEREIEHEWTGCKCTRCGETRNEGHLPDNGKCSICGIKMKPINSFTADEIRLLCTIMAVTQAGGKKLGEKETETHAEALVKIFMYASLTGKGWLIQSDINFIGKYIQTMFNVERDNGNRLEAEKYGKLLSKLLKMKNSF